MTPDLSDNARRVLSVILARPDSAFGLKDRSGMPIADVATALRELRALGHARIRMDGRWEPGRSADLPAPRDWVSVGERKVIAALPPGHYVTLSEIVRRVGLERHYVAQVVRRLVAFGVIASDFRASATYSRGPRADEALAVKAVRRPSPVTRHTEERQELLRVISDAGERGVRIAQIVTAMRRYAHPDTISKWCREYAASGDVECVGATHGYRHGRWRIAGRYAAPVAVVDPPTKPTPPAPAFDDATLAAMARARESTIRQLRRCAA